MRVFILSLLALGITFAVTPVTAKTLLHNQYRDNYRYHDVGIDPDPFIASQLKRDYWRDAVRS